MHSTSKQIQTFGEKWLKKKSPSESQLSDKGGAESQSEDKQQSRRAGREKCRVGRCSVVKHSQKAHNDKGKGSGAQRRYILKHN